VSVADVQLTIQGVVPGMHVHPVFEEDGYRWSITCYRMLPNHHQVVKVPVAISELLASRVPAGPTSPWPRVYEWEVRP